MAGLILAVNSGEVALVAATAKTALQIKAPANQRLIVRSIRVHGKSAAGGTDVPVHVRLTRSTANFGTGTSATPAKLDPGMGETVQSTAACNFTVEPTSPTDGGMAWKVSPQSGLIDLFPPGCEIRIPGGEARNVELTSPSTPTLIVTAVYEE